MIEKAKSNYSAYVPDLPGCVATGATIVETQQQIQQAILFGSHFVNAFHLQRLREDNLPIPEPTTLCEYVEVS
ncbi:hypothetical protein NIES4075_40030 [Tolypothrix sp. NIES-4075]|uniref:type II toxin-antitoxin system HicB family antitoxin n=1 Tax=Tolypothrix sp. NIES-4075 TaxID=2005459 RepID=UPI000B5C370E|nr:type II toxin-antitoxin system HicB family antitoxin [Tolypothrix sp. NIES-4075]GAX42994.1 hypothetical protein NIES4075_40030 [Tolypothrix sp. NIES-4075]